jgi:hypothetical protein
MPLIRVIRWLWLISGRGELADQFKLLIFVRHLQFWPTNRLLLLTLSLHLAPFFFGGELGPLFLFTAEPFGQLAT